VPSVRPDEPLDEAFSKMQQYAYPALPVVDDSGRLLGLISAENIGEMVMINSLRPKDGKRSWRVAQA